MATTAEKDLYDVPRHGFPALAAFLARDPDHETFVFRKFSCLTVRNLIHLQNELADLEQQLKTLDWKLGIQGDVQSRLALRDWEHFKSSAKEPSRDEVKLEYLAAEIQQKLEQYQNALLRAGSVAQLGRPAKRVIDVFKQEFAHMDISGYSGSMLDDDEDLAALKPAEGTDVLSTFLRDHWPLPARSLADPHYPQAQHFQNKQLQLLVSTISVAIAAILLTGSILTLYFVTAPDVRLGLLIFFIMLFAIGIRVSTTATRDSIFAATAAYAAVLVVFVSGDLGKAQKS